MTTLGWLLACFLIGAFGGYIIGRRKSRAGEPLKLPGFKRLW